MTNCKVLQTERDVYVPTYVASQSIYPRASHASVCAGVLTCLQLKAAAGCALAGSVGRSDGEVVALSTAQVRHPTGGVCGGAVGNSTIIRYSQHSVQQCAIFHIPRYPRGVGDAVYGTINALRSARSYRRERYA